MPHWISNDAYEMRVAKRAPEPRAPEQRVLAKRVPVMRALPSQQHAPKVLPALRAYPNESHSLPAHDLPTVLKRKRPVWGVHAASFPKMQ